MKDKMIIQLTDEIDKQATQFKTEKSQDEAKKKMAEKERVKAIFNRARVNSQGGSSSEPSPTGN